MTDIEAEEHTRLQKELQQSQQTLNQRYNFIKQTVLHCTPLPNDLARIVSQFYEDLIFTDTSSAEEFCFRGFLDVYKPQEDEQWTQLCKQMTEDPDFWWQTAEKQTMQQKKMIERLEFAQRTWGWVRTANGALVPPDVPKWNRNTLVHLPEWMPPLSPVVWMFPFLIRPFDKDASSIYGEWKFFISCGGDGASVVFCPGDSKHKTRNDVRHV